MNPPPLSHCALAARDLALLGRGGFRDVGDVEGLSAADFGAALKVGEAEASRLLEEVRASGRAAPRQVSARELLAASASLVPVVTFCRSLDDALGGGVAPRSVLEVVGAPGTGKTQLCLQVCVDAAIPVEFHGPGGGAVYVDADGSFSPERCAAIAREMVRHVKRLARRKRPREGREAPAETPGEAAARAAAAKLDVDAVLEGITVFRALDHADVFHALARAEALCADGGCKVLVVDSVAAHLRSLDVDVGGRARLLARLSLDLAAIANRHDVAVLVTNQLTTKLHAGNQILPALGEAWSHAPDLRVLLHADERQGADGVARRTATFLKSPHHPPSHAVPFAIDARGVRDPPKPPRPPP